VQRSTFPLLEAYSAELALIVIGRITLALGAGVLLVLVTALPLVRRVRGLAEAMRRVVDRDFQGSVKEGSNDEIGEVAAAFDAAAGTARERLRRLEDRDALLRRALADLAHDLRTPLATLQLSASSLPLSPTTSAMRAELGFLEGMTRNFEALLGGDEEGERIPVALDDLVQRVWHRFAPLARDRGLTFETAAPDESLRATADPVALERAVSNLAQNALRFARGHVVVVLFRDGEEARVEVRDDGPGLGDLAQRAAERGVRGASTAEQGFGLGLAIAESTARRFGGRLELRDGEEGGAVAAIVLPRLSG
jgi:signal transduction histidine kinase